MAANLRFAGFSLVFLSMSCAHQTWQYPVTERTNFQEVLHGQTIKDPYRWLENLNSAQTKEWVQKQKAFTNGYLEKLPHREKIKEKLVQLWNYEKYSAPIKRGKYYFYRHNTGLQNQSILYLTQDPKKKGKILIDPNKLSQDGTVALNTYEPSPHGNFIVYSVTQSGSDWKTWHLMEVASQKNLDDTIQWTKFTNISWSPDESGFYYTGYKAPKQEGKKHQTQTYFSKVYFHRLGTPQSQDQIIYDDPNTKDAMFDLQVSDDGTHLILEISKGTDNRNQVFIRPRKSNQNHWTTLIGNWDAGYRYICTHEKQLVFLSTKDAPSGKVVSIDPQNPKTWTTFVPEKRDVLRKVSRTKTHLVLQYLNNAHSQIELLNLKNRKSSILQLPGIGSAWGTNTKKTSDEIFIAFSSFNQPTTIYHLDARNPQIRLWRKPNASFTPEDFVTEQVFYSSKDGTKIPMFISHHKSIEKDGTNPLYLFGYGGFNISMTPHFNPKYIAWMEMGGVVAIPNLRGGGEYGEDWHKAGTKTNKQNVFDDFIGAAEYLHQNLYSIPQKTAIVGRSNGGLLVAASLLQRPDLFGAVVAQVGVLDMLRFHKFTIGWAWTDDYGNPDNPIDFKHLLSYSPLHNIHNGVYYPPTLVTTADTDDRVVPSHSFKFIAALQHASAGLDPLLIRIETKSGHGSGTPTAKRIDKAADVFSFLTQNLHVDL